MKRLFLICLLAVAGMAGAWAYDFEVDGIYYDITDGAALEVEVTYRSSASYSGEVVIPGSVFYNGSTYRVTGIGQGAFQYCSSLTSVTIPDGVTSIESSAFSGCSSLTSVNIPDGVTSIGEQAFYDCSSLTSVTIGNGVTSIGDDAFQYCSSLTSVSIPDGMTSIGEKAFYDCSSLTSVNIPDGVKSIGRSAFYNSGIYNNGDNWENGALYISNHLIEGYDIKGAYEIKENTKTIADWAFNSCSGLTSVNIPNGMTSIGSSAFYNCSSMTLVNIPDEVKSIGDYAFYNCSSLTSVNIPDGVKSIGRSAFYNSGIYNNGNNWESGALYISNHLIVGIDIEGAYSIKESTKTIADLAFRDCSGLTSVNIPDGITNIGYGTFSGCSSLTSITIPDGVTSIGERAFSDCSSLTSIIIPDGVTSIGSYAFSGCDNLTSVSIGEGVRNIGGHTFYGCYNLTSVVWNAIHCEDFTSNDTPFYYNDGSPANMIHFNVRGKITAFTFGDKVEHVPAHLCAWMPQLSSLIIPSAVTSIGSGAFASCKQLTTIVVDAANVAFCVQDGVLFNKNKTTLIVYPPSLQRNVYTIPDGVLRIDEGAFSLCGKLVSISIPESVTNIGDNAFTGCSKLPSITIPEGVKKIGGGVFIDCSSLVSIVWNAIHCEDFVSGNPFFRVEGHYGAFKEDTRKNITSFVLGDRVEYLPTGLCEYMEQLISVNIPAKVKSIGNYAFRRCYNLSSVLWNADSYEDLTSNYTPFYHLERNTTTFYDLRTQITSFTFGEHVKHIPAWLCAGMTELTSVTIGEKVESIGSSAFENCGNLSTLLYNGTLESWCEIDFSTVTSNPMSYAKRMFINQQQLAGDLILPEGVTEVKDYAFYGCKELTSVVIPDGATLIGNSTFYDCSRLTSVAIGEGVVHIGENAFLNCAAVKDIYCYALVPPGLSGNPFVSLSYGANLYVPCGTEFDYSITGYWAAFENIMGVEYQVQVSTNDASKGTVALTRPVLCETSEAVIQATPAEGFRFVQWNDGNTDNPRTVTVTSDTTFTGLFASSSTCYVRISANDPTMGSVVGSGGYEQGTTATIAAVPAEGYRFVQWSDGNTDNPRTLTVTEDVSLAAEFAPATESGIDDITRQLVVTTNHCNILICGATDSALSVYTMQGTCLYRGTAEAEPAIIPVPSAGMYVVMVGDKMVKVVVR